MKIIIIIIIIILNCFTVYKLPVSVQSKPWPELPPQMLIGPVDEHDSDGSCF